jgi:hypothetical protein
MSDKQAEMWQAFEAHKPDASYADAWATMCRERTWAAMAKAYYAAPVGSAAKVAAEAAAWAPWAAWAAGADRHAQEAIDAIREVKP